MNTSRSNIVANCARDEADDFRCIPHRANNNWTSIYGLQSEESKELQTNKAMHNTPYAGLLRNELLGSSITLSNSTNKERLFKYQPPKEPQTPFSSSISSASHSLLTNYKRTKPIAVIEPLRTIDAPMLRCYHNLQLIDWSKNNTVALGLHRTVALWDPIKRQAQPLIEQNDPITALAWHKNGRTLAVGTLSGVLNIWNNDSAQVEENLDGQYKRICALAWHGDMLYVGSKDGRLLIWDLEYAWDDPIYLQGHTEDICSLQSSANGKYMASSAYDQKVLIWTGERDKPLHVLSGHKGPVHGLAWSPQNNELLVSGGGKQDASLRFWNMLTGNCVQIVYTKNEITKLAWSPKSNELITTHIGTVEKAIPDIVVWRYPSMKQEKHLVGHKDWIFHLAVSADGDNIITGSADGTLCLWSAFSTQKKSKPTFLDMTIR